MVLNKYFLNYGMQIINYTMIPNRLYVKNFKTYHYLLLKLFYIQDNQIQVIIKGLKKLFLNE